MGFNLIIDFSLFDYIRSRMVIDKKLFKQTGACLVWKDLCSTMEVLY